MREPNNPTVNVNSRRTSRRRVLAASGALALGAMPTAMAAPAFLAGTTLCLSPTTSVFVSGVPGPNPYQVADQLYAETKALFRARGVRYVEASVCKTSPAALTLVLDVTPLLRETGVETKVSSRLDDQSRGEARRFSNAGLLWSAVTYGKSGTGEAAIKAQLLEDARSVLNRLVNDWKAVNR